MREPPETSTPRTTLAFKLGLAVGIVGLAVWIGNLVWTGQEKFERVDASFDSMMPVDKGLAAAPVRAGSALIILRISHVSSEGRREPGFVVHIDGSEPAYALPRSWSGYEQESKSRRAQYEAVFAGILSAVREEVAQFDVPIGQVRGEIISALADGASAPAGILMSALNVFLKAGMSDLVCLDDASPATLREVHTSK